MLLVAVVIMCNYVIMSSKKYSKLLVSIVKIHQLSICRQSPQKCDQPKQQSKSNIAP